MAKVRDQEHEEEGAPDFEVVGGAEDEGLVEREREVQVAELAEDDVHAGREGGGGRVGGRVGHLEVLLWGEEGGDGADEGRDRFDVEEEDAVGERVEGSSCHSGWR